MTLSTAAASATVLAGGPTVSGVCEIGTTPARLLGATVGFVPEPPVRLDGQTMLPSVSEPSATTHRLAETAAPDPELDPHGLRSRAYGLLHCPPRPLQP